MNTSTLEILQGELERLFDLAGLMQLSADVLCRAEAGEGRDLLASQKW